jgi:hypothetical protein
MSLFTALYDGSLSGFSVPVANYGAYPTVYTVVLGIGTFGFPPNFNPDTLASATPQDFANSLAAEINIIMGEKLGAGNFTPIVCTATTFGVNISFIFSNFEIKDNILITPFVGAFISGTADLNPASLNQIFALGAFAELTPTGGNPLQIAGAPRTYISDMFYRGQFPTNPIP